MPNRVHNWKFRDVSDFLKEHGFRLHYTNASHYYFINSTLDVVCVPYHAAKSIKPRTLKSIIVQSKISQATWFKK